MSLYPKKSEEKLKKIIDESLDDLVTSKVNKNRQIKFWRGCKTDGIREGFTHCGDETCEQCNHLDDVLREEMLKQKDLFDGKV